MSNNIISVTKFTTTDAFKADPKIAAPSLETVRNAAGSNNPLIGSITANPENGYLITGWESKAHHETVLSDKGLHESLGKVFKEFKELVHMAPVIDPTPALTAPTTEVATWTLNPETSREEFQTILPQILGEFNHWAKPTSNGVYGGGWGPVLEDERRFIVILGWESADAFRKFMGSPDAETVMGHITRARSLAHIQLELMTLNSFASS